MKNQSILKVVITGTIIVGLLAGNSAAQENRSRLGWGAKIGANSAKHSQAGKGTNIAEPKIGFVGGAFVTYSLSEKLALQGEFLYSMKGWKLPLSPDVDVKLDYFEIPILARYYLTAGESVAGAIVAGPALGILLSAKADGIDNKDQFESTDFGFVLGGMADILVGQSKLSLEVRYTLGLSDISKADDGGPDPKHQVLSLMVGYTIQ